MASSLTLDISLFHKPPPPVGTRPQRAARTAPGHPARDRTTTGALGSCRHPSRSRRASAGLPRRRNRVRRRQACRYRRSARARRGPDQPPEDRRRAGPRRARRTAAGRPEGRGTAPSAAQWYPDRRSGPLPSPAARAGECAVADPPRGCSTMPGAQAPAAGESGSAPDPTRRDSTQGAGPARSWEAAAAVDAPLPPLLGPRGRRSWSR